MRPRAARWAISLSLAVGLVTAAAPTSARVVGIGVSTTSYGVRANPTSSPGKSRRSRTRSPFTNVPLRLF